MDQQHLGTRVKMVARLLVAVAVGFGVGELLRVSAAQADCNEERIGLAIERINVPAGDREFWEGAQQTPSHMVPYALILPTGRWRLKYEGE